MPRIYDIIDSPFTFLNLRYHTSWEVFECEECGQTEYLNAEAEENEEAACPGCGCRLYIQMQPVVEKLVPLY